MESVLGKEPENPLKKVYGGIILGSEKFIKKVLSRLERDPMEKPLARVISVSRSHGV